MACNQDAVRWSAQNFDRNYQFAWWSTTLTILIVSGSADRIVTQWLWQANRFHTDNVIWCVIADAGHFPWIEQPVAVRNAFAEVTQRISTHRRSG
jgi:pimeloyl-ACP methyl ester carboxylesterase